MNIVYDAVIAGGGLSGLSLAGHLAAGAWRDRSVLVIDDATIRPAATGWGWWSATPGLLDAAASRSFGQVRVHAAGTSRVLPLGHYRYRVVRRDALRTTVDSLMASCPRFTHVQGHVQQVRDAGALAEVVLDGDVIRARWAFDSVHPPPADRIDARLAFTGYEVHSDRRLFDPETPVLFDFRPIDEGFARFAYVLPEDSHRALVELTDFVPRHTRPQDETMRRRALEAYLCDVIGATDHRVLRTESAVLGLRTSPAPRRHGRVLAIGAHGGLIKASTGYAYQRIQRDSAAIAESLVRHDHPFAVARSRGRHRMLDALLLDVLDQTPSELERAFAAIFTANPVERVLRFLDEATDLVDELRLIASMPPGPFVRALGRRAFRRRP